MKKYSGINIVSKVVKKLTMENLNKHLELAEKKIESDGKYIITPEIATALLSRNPCNRSISPAAVEGHVRDMLNNDFQGNVGDEITVDWNGHLNNGQHRLDAVRQSKTNQQFFLRFGIDPKTREVEGRGRIKTHPDTIIMQHGDKIRNRNNISAMARFLCCFKLNPYTPQGFTGNYKPSQAEVNKSFNNCHKQFTESFDFVSKHHADKVMVPNTAAIAHFLYANTTYGKKKADEFMEGICTGINLSKDDPRYVIRERLSSNRGLEKTKYKKTGNAEKITVSWRSQGAKDISLGILNMGWNAFVKGKKWSSKVRNPDHSVRIGGLDSIDGTELYTDIPSQGNLTL